LEGSDKTYVNERGNLVFTTRFGEVAMAELKTYQEKDKKVITSQFIKRGGKWGIALASYDKTQALIIDPLVYSTYIGGSGDDEGYGIAVDGSGNAYITGYTNSTDYAVTAGTFQTTYGGGSYDVFVTKLNASGSAVVYSTYIGGSSVDSGYGIAVDGSGNAYITGYTNSTDYDVTVGAFQTTYGGGIYDVFVTKLNASGSGLDYSTYIGGSGWDEGRGIALDGSGNAYVTGMTNSSDYVVTAGAFQTTYGGGGDVFVTKLNASGSGLVYSTYIGGTNEDSGYGIAVDGSGNVYVTGSTNSIDYAVTAGVLQTSLGGSYDVFVTKLNTSGSGLLYSTYIGVSGDEYGNGIAVDGIGNAYVTGQAGNNFVVTGGAFQTSFGGSYDVFVTKLNASGSAVVYSTYIGGNGYEYGYGIAVDGSGNVYVTGSTNSLDYDVTAGAFQTTNEGNYNVFVTKLNASGSGLVYSTYIGGSNFDYGKGIALDGSGNAYITGQTQSTDYDVTTGAFQTTYGGGTYDVFVTKLNMSVTAVENYANVEWSLFSIYPNPTSGTYTLQTEKGGEFELMDMHGRVIRVFKMQNPIEQIQVNLSNGIYFIREKASGVTQRVIIE
jgi:hypothetical protein